MARRRRSKGDIYVGNEHRWSKATVIYNDKTKVLIIKAPEGPAGAFVTVATWENMTVLSDEAVRGGDRTTEFMTDDGQITAIFPGCGCGK